MKRFVAVLSGLLVLPAFAEVAPFVDGLIHVSQIAENVTKSGTFKLPKYCPCCGEVLEEHVNKNGIKNLYCPNEDCMARNAQRLARFCIE